MVGDILFRSYLALPWIAALAGIVVCAFAVFGPVEIPRYESLPSPSASVDEGAGERPTQNRARFQPLWKVRLFSPAVAKPREPADAVNALPVFTPPPKPPLVLKSILHSPKSRIAIFSHEGIPGALRLSEGQSAVGVEVRRIEPGFVEVIFQGQSFVIPLAAPPATELGK